MLSAPTHRANPDRVSIHKRPAPKPTTTGDSKRPARADLSKEIATWQQSRPDLKDYTWPCIHYACGMGKCKGKTRCANHKKRPHTDYKKGLTAKQQGQALEWMQAYPPFHVKGEGSSSD